jgi:hypothetical protein
MFAHLLEVRRAGQRRENREPRLKELVPLDESPEPLEIAFLPRRIDDEIAGHTVAETPRHVFFRPSRPSSVAASSPKKMSNCRASGRHSSSRGACRATVSTRL